MADRSQRRPLHSEKDQSGCVWGFISMLDFRQGRFTQKLLSDKRHGSSRHAVGAGYSRRTLRSLGDTEERHQGNNDGDESEASKVDIGNRSVNELMEKEIPSELGQSNLEHRGHLGKKRKQTSKTCKVACDIHAHDSKASTSLESQESYHLNSIEQFPHLDLSALMEEFCSQIRRRQEICMYHENEGDSFNAQKSSNSPKHKQLDKLDMQLVQKHFILQEKMSEEAEAFLNQKLVDAKKHTQDGAIHQSKQFMDALEILISNKELLSKLLQDSNSPLMKHIQDLQDPQLKKVKSNNSLAGVNLSEKHIGDSREGGGLDCRKQVWKQNMHTFFRRKVKSPSRNPSKGSDSPQASNQIVVLKPSSTGIRNSATETSHRSSSQSHYSLKSQGQSGRFNSQFSISEIKRKLKHAMRESKKERHWISMDGILHKIPYKRQDSGNDGKRIAGGVAGGELPSKTHFHSENTAHSTISKGIDKIVKPTHGHRSNGHEVASTSANSCQNLTSKTDGYPKSRESNFYIEARKHLAEMLSNEDEDGNLSTQRTSRTLGRILSLPEYTCSPVFSPGRDGEHRFVTAQMRLSPYGSSQIVSENIWRPKQDSEAYHPIPLRMNLVTLMHATSGYSPEVELQVNDSNADISEELLPDIKMEESVCSSTEDSSPEGGAEIIEITDVVCMEESNFLDAASETNSSTPITITDTNKIWEEEGSAKCLGLDSPTKDQPPSSSLGSFSPSCLVIQKIEALESINNGPERPSPVSVLEPYFLEEVISPASTISQPEHESSSLVVTPLDRENYLQTCIADKEPTFEYVRAVLQASDLSWDEFLGKYHSSDQPLDPSLFDEVEFISTPLCGDRELLFDCINEALAELFDRYFGCSPWVAFVNPKIRPVPVGKNLIHEVWEGIDWRLPPMLLPRTLDQIVGKDMEQARTWMDLRFDTEGIGTEIGDIILEELIEDAIFDLSS